MPDREPPNMTTTDQDLSAEVHHDRVNDLVRKLEEVTHQAGNVPEEVYPALANLLITRFTEAGDPDRAYRVFTMMLAVEFDQLMDEIEDGMYDE